MTPMTPPKEFVKHGRKDAAWRDQIEEQARNGDSLQMTVSNRSIADICRMLLDSASFPHNKFRYITIANSGIGKEGARHLADLIGQNNRRLVCLDLRFNSIGGGLDFFQNALLQNRCLQELLVKSNNITAKGIKLLCQGLANNTSLRVLDLCANPKIGDKGAQTIANEFLWPLRARTNLRELYLAECLIGDAGACELARVFNGTPPSRLERLDLSRNQISNRGAGCFQGPLQDHHNSLQVLDLQDNDKISGNKVQDLRNAAADNGRRVRV